MSDSPSITASGAHARVNASPGPRPALLASLGHTFRTPLNQIFGYQQILSEGIAGELTEGQVGYLSKVASAAAELSSLIDDLVALGEVDAGWAEMEPTGCFIDSLVHAALAEVCRVREKDPSSFVREPGPQGPLPADLFWIGRMLRAVLMAADTLANDAPVQVETGHAANADGPEATALVRASVASSPRTEQLLELIADGGLDMAKAEKLCHGLGIRLTLAGRIAELHGGTLDVRRVAGGGLAIEARLPATSGACLGQEGDREPVMGTST